MAGGAPFGSLPCVSARPERPHDPVNLYDQELADVLEGERLKGRRVLIDGRVRYASEEERLEARRATYRRSQQRKYRAYRELCERYGVPVRSGNWSAHFRRLRDVDGVADGCLLKAYWLLNFSAAEIAELGWGLAPLNDALSAGVALSGAAPSISEGQRVPLGRGPQAAPLTDEEAA